MEPKKDIKYSEQTFVLIDKIHGAISSTERHDSAGNDKAINTALIYEKFRTAVEYQEEHLILKNAISRILRRQYTLAAKSSASTLYDGLINELAWANYINPDALKDDKVAAIKAAVERYLILLKHIQSGRYNKHESSKLILDWLAIEIEQILHPDKSRDIFLDFIFNILKPKISIKGASITEEELKLSLKLAIYTQLFRPDDAMEKYCALLFAYPNWKNLDKNEIIKFARSFDPNINISERILFNKYRKRITLFVKRAFPPFKFIYVALTKKALDKDYFAQNPKILQQMAFEEYRLAVADATHKVWRATIRALIFILITKLSLAFLIEIPFDKYLYDKIDYLSLIINISLPPLLMFVAGISIKQPNKKNNDAINSQIKQILFENTFGDKDISLAERKLSHDFQVFNVIYSLFSYAVIGLVVWLLLLLHFNFVSIMLFFFFVSAVSFFSFRIRNIMVDLTVHKGREGAITSTVELFFLPFIRIGKYFSDSMTTFNPFILALDFLIEAPLKSIIKVITSWFKFVNTKKEEIDY